MRKRKMCLLCGFTASVVFTLFTAVVLVLKHEPTFYGRSYVPASPERKQLSTQFVNRFGQLMVDVGVDRGTWNYSFSETQLNSFFAEDFVNYGEADNLRKLHISEPRLLIDDDHVRLAFRYGHGLWSTVMSYDLKVWIVPREPNVLAVEVLGRRAGALPISSQTMINELAELASRHNMEVTAYRHNGHPVALIRFQADRARPTTILQCLKLEPGNVTVAGTSPDALPSAKAPTALAPSGN
jgi:hypothetical protein